MTDNQRVNEYADAADALFNWFDSQDIDIPKAVAIMAYLIGACAAAGAENDYRKAMRMIDAAETGMRGTCMTAMILKLKRD